MVNYSDVLLNKNDSILVPNNSIRHLMDSRSLDSHVFYSIGHTPIAKGSELFDGSQNSLEISLKGSVEAIGWAHLPLQHYWNIGYQARPMLNVMMQLPPRLRIALRRFADALHYMAQDATKNLENKTHLSGIDSYMADVPDVSHCGHPDEAMAWEEELEYGLIRIEFYPVSQGRKRFDVNTRAAHIWNSTKDQLLDRFQACDVPSQLTDIDWIRAFAAYITAYFDDTVTQILRFTTICGETVDAKLVSVTTTKTFDPVARISQAPAPPPEPQNLAPKPTPCPQAARRNSYRPSPPRDARRRSGARCASSAPPSTTRPRAARRSPARTCSRGTAAPASSSSTPPPPTPAAPSGARQRAARARPNSTGSPRSSRRASRTLSRPCAPAAIGARRGDKGQAIMQRPGRRP